MNPIKQKKLLNTYKTNKNNFWTLIKQKTFESLQEKKFWAFIKQKNFWTRTKQKNFWIFTKRKKKNEHLPNKGWFDVFPIRLHRFVLLKIGCRTICVCSHLEEWLVNSPSSNLCCESKILRMENKNVNLLR